MEQHVEALIHSSVHSGEVLMKISSLLSSTEQGGTAGCSVSWHWPCPQSLGGAAAPSPQPHILPFSAPHPCLGVFIPNVMLKEESGVQMKQGLTK